MKLKAKNHTIKAFQFIGEGTKYPEWFDALVVTGKASVTINHKECHITLYDADGMPKRCNKGQYVCKNKSGAVFALDEIDIKEQFYE